MHGCKQLMLKESDTMPLFSIITVCYNAPSTIERTALSVASQSFNDYEHLIIDGKSKDNTLDLLNSAIGNEKRIVHSERDSGIYDAMNKSLAHANGKYLIFLNAGDKFHTQNSLKQIADSINNTNPAIVYGQTILVGNNGEYIAPRHLTAPPTLETKDFAKGMLVCHQAFIVKKDIAPEYNLKYKFSADYDWCIRCLMLSDNNNTYIDDVLIDYLSEGITTANRRRSLIERFKIMSHYFGFFPTLARHFGFISRFMKHQKIIKQAN